VYACSLFYQTSRSTSASATGTVPANTTPRFLASENPQQVKRTLLASFTDVLLLPVTVVPRAVGSAAGAVGAGIYGAGSAGIAMLNPQRWGGGAGISSGNDLDGGGAYSRNFDGEALFELGDDEDDDNTLGSLNLAIEEDDGG
jgi:recyclin-1